MRITFSLIMLFSLSCVTNADEHNWITLNNKISKGNQPMEETYYKGQIYHNITYNKNDVIIFLGSLDKPFSWLTKCFKSYQKGISEVICLTQNFDKSKADENQIQIAIHQNKNLIMFKPLNAIEINYKVDSKPITTIKRDYISNRYTQYSILQDLLGSEKLIYSFKEHKNGKYSSRTYNIEGLEEHINISKQIIEKNS